MQYGKKWKKENRELVLKNKYEWEDKNRDKVNAYRRRRQKERCNSDSQFKLLVNMRIRLWSALKGKLKSKSTRKLLGCSLEELQQHLQKQFRNNMSWENYGSVWSVDHIRPCASFDLSDPEQQRICFHYLNLQPLLIPENSKKKDKWSHLGSSVT